MLHRGGPTTDFMFFRSGPGRAPCQGQPPLWQRMLPFSQLRAASSRVPPGRPSGSAGNTRLSGPGSLGQPRRARPFCRSRSEAVRVFRLCAAKKRYGRSKDASATPSTPPWWPTPPRPRTWLLTAREGKRGTALLPARPAHTPRNRLFGQATPGPRPSRELHTPRDPSGRLRKPEKPLDTQRGLVPRSSLTSWSRKFSHAMRDVLGVGSALRDWSSSYQYSRRPSPA